MKKTALAIALLAMALCVSAQESRYHGSVDAGWGMQFPVGDNGTRAMFAFTTTHGWQLTSNVFVGAGVGVSVVQSNYGQKAAYPAYAAMKYDFMPDSEVGPIVALRFGRVYGSGRNFATAMAGLRLSEKPHMRWNLMAVYGFNNDGYYGMNAGLMLSLEY